MTKSNTTEEIPKDEVIVQRVRPKRAHYYQYPPPEEVHPNSFRVGISMYGMMPDKLWYHRLQDIGMETVVYELGFDIPAFPDIDYLILDGGGDTHPWFYGQSVAKETKNIDYERDLLEMSLLRYYLRHSTTKIVGICRGHQFINAILGGCLTQDLGKQNQSHPSKHLVKFKEGTIVHQQMGEKDLYVNSLHHQAVTETGWKLFTTMWHPGFQTIEGTESISSKIRTVQCHPEYTEEIRPGTAFTGNDKMMRYLFHMNGKT